MCREKHNSIKRSLLERYCKPGSSLADIGFGRGGDMHKWNSLKLKVWGVEPDPQLFEEALQRGLKRNTEKVQIGDSRILANQNVIVDTVSYMFSIHYILHDIYY